MKVRSPDLEANSSRDKSNEARLLFRPEVGLGDDAVVSLALCDLFAGEEVLKSPRAANKQACTLRGTGRGRLKGIATIRTMNNN